MAATTQTELLVRNMDRATARAYVAELFDGYLARIASLTNANVVVETENMAAEAEAISEAMSRYPDLRNVRARLSSACSLRVLHEDGKIDPEQVERYTTILTADVAKLRS